MSRTKTNEEATMARAATAVDDHFRHLIVRFEGVKSLGIIGVAARLYSNYFTTILSPFLFYQTLYKSGFPPCTQFGCRCTNRCMFLVQNVLLHLTISPIPHWFTYCLSLKII